MSSVVIEIKSKINSGNSETPKTQAAFDYLIGSRPICDIIINSYAADNHYSIIIICHGAYLRVAVRKDISQNSLYFNMTRIIDQIINNNILLLL